MVIILDVCTNEEYGRFVSATTAAKFCCECGLAYCCSSYQDNGDTIWFVEDERVGV